MQNLDFYKLINWNNIPKKENIDKKRQNLYSGTRFSWNILCTNVGNIFSSIS